MQNSSPSNPEWMLHGVAPGLPPPPVSTPPPASIPVPPVAGASAASDPHPATKANRSEDHERMRMLLMMPPSDTVSARPDSRSIREGPRAGTPLSGSPSGDPVVGPVPAPLGSGKRKSPFSALPLGSRVTQMCATTRLDGCANEPQPRRAGLREAGPRQDRSGSQKPRPHAA